VDLSPQALARLVGLCAVGGVADYSPLRRVLGYADVQFQVEFFGGDASRFAEDGLAQYLLGVADAAGIGLAGGGCQLVAPLVGAVGLTAVGDVGCGLFLHPGDLVDDGIALEEADGTVLARFKAEVSVEGGLVVFSRLVAINHHESLRRHFPGGQRIGLLQLVGSANLVVTQLDGLVSGL